MLRKFTEVVFDKLYLEECDSVGDFVISWFRGLVF